MSDPTRMLNVDFDAGGREVWICEICGMGLTMQGSPWNWTCCPWCGRPIHDTRKLCLYEPEDSHEDLIEIARQLAAARRT